MARHPLCGTFRAVLLACGVALSLAAGVEHERDDWAEKWCELNDCNGVKAAEHTRAVNARLEREQNKAQRRYEATGEIRAVKSEAVQHALFAYDGPTLDHPGFPGVAAKIGERDERINEAFAVAARKDVETRAITPATPTGGYLLPGTEEANHLAVRQEHSSAVAAAQRRHSMMKEELRIGCMYEYGHPSDGKGGFLMGRITTLKSLVKGCAAGSVWNDQGGGGCVSRRARQSRRRACGARSMALTASGSRTSRTCQRDFLGPRRICRLLPFQMLSHRMY